MYSLTMNLKKQDKTTKKTPVSSVTPTIGKDKVTKKATASNAGKSKKYRPSAAMVKRELAMQARGTGKNAGKKVGPKATAQRIAAKRVGKTTKKQELAMAKRGKK